MGAVWSHQVYALCMLGRRSVIDVGSVRSAMFSLWENSGSFERPRVILSNCGLRFTLRRGRKKRGELVYQEKPQYYRLLVERRGAEMTERDLGDFLQAATMCMQTPPPVVTRAMMGGGYFLEWDVRGPPKGQESSDPGQRVVGELMVIQRLRTGEVGPPPGRVVPVQQAGTGQKTILRTGLAERMTPMEQGVLF